MKTKDTDIFLFVLGVNIFKLVGFLLLFLLVVFSLSGILTSLKPQYRLSLPSVNQVSTNLEGKLLYQIMGWENHHFLSFNHHDVIPKWPKIIFNLSSNINFDDPRSMLGKELPGFFQFDGQIVAAGEGANFTNLPMESSPPNEIMKAEREASLQNLGEFNAAEKENPNVELGQTTGKHKVVYVYFTHNRESYLPYLKGITDPDNAYHSQINVTKIGDQLKTSLEDRGIGIYVDKTDVMGSLAKKGLKMPFAYTESGNVFRTAMANNRDLHYFIDIHRDAKRKAQTTVSINGKSYAKLSFVIGGKNPNYEKNEKLATELHNLLQKKYKGLSWGVMTKRGSGSNGVYNQNLSSNAILIEFGGVDNTFEELNRSADALADVFSDYYWEAEKVNKNLDQSTKKQ